MTTRDRILASGFFDEPPALSFGRQLVAKVRIDAVPAEVIFREALRTLGKLVEHYQREPKAPRDFLDAAVAARAQLDKVVSQGLPRGGDSMLDGWLWMTFDAFGEVSRIDVIGEDDVPPGDLSGTLPRGGAA